MTCVGDGPVENQPPHVSGIQQLARLPPVLALRNGCKRTTPGTASQNTDAPEFHRAPSSGQAFPIYRPKQVGILAAEPSYIPRIFRISSSAISSIFVADCAAFNAVSI